ncbi:unnamed protein product (macronuclear) [Paramecium tetraurelia]|uniref:Uncharacterized protein n=1 Tax=Paramecium tetraurelia TaxID=5888 RepID=A0DWX1_PARTE|nr:uncharacterized protein GSPATT00021181001 [Paramecium tetraurelia]CAK87538.1 unnamed protein product [Paramecium tetraurelia]|eukprot:XP_001454935.1 hypothetical protein (macronuclear) [Paramecium tetraurelia strain d4-2]
MDAYLTLELRKRFNSSMTYQEYLDAYDKPPPKPKLKPKESPVVAELLLLEPPKGPKPQSQKLEIYEPDEIILEESETDERSRAQSPIQKPPCYKALKANNVRVRSQSENFVFSVYRFLQNKQHVPKQ